MKIKYSQSRTYQGHQTRWHKLGKLWPDIDDDDDDICINMDSNFSSHSHMTQGWAKCERNKVDVLSEDIWRDAWKTLYVAQEKAVYLKL